MAYPVGQLDLLDDLLGAGPGVAAGPQPAQDRPADHPRQQDVLEEVQLRQQVVELEDEADAVVAQAAPGTPAQREDVAPLIRDRAFVRQIQGSEDVQQGALAAAAGAHDGDELARLDGQGGAVEHAHRLAPHDVGLEQALGFQQWFTHNAGHPPAKPERPTGRESGHPASRRQ